MKRGSVRKRRPILKRPTLNFGRRKVVKRDNSIIRDNRNKTNNVKMKSKVPKERRIKPSRRSRRQ